MVIVGPMLDDVAGRVVFVREDQPGSGPLAGIGAGLSAVSTPLLGVIAADMPFALPTIAGALTRLAGTGSERAGRGVDAIVPVDPAGHRQLLCAAYSTDALRAVLAALGPLAGLPVRALQPGLDVMEWPVFAAELADVDTLEQLAAARSRAAEEDRDMQEWVDAGLGVREAPGSVGSGSPRTVGRHSGNPLGSGVDRHAAVADERGQGQPARPGYVDGQRGGG